MKTVKIDFSKLEIFDIDGNVVKEIEDKNGNKIPYSPYKTIANFIYYNVKNIDMVEIARDINAGNEISISEKELNEIKELIVNQSKLPSFIRHAIDNFIGNTINAGA